MKKLKIAFFMGLSLTSAVLVPGDATAEKKKQIRVRWHNVLTSARLQALSAIFTAENQDTQSARHFKKSEKEIIDTLKSFLIWSPDKQDRYGIQKFSVMRHCLRKERMLVKAGYVTFYHAQESKKFIPIKLDSLLYSIRTGHNSENFLLLHTKQDPVFAAMRAQNGTGAENGAQEVKNNVLAQERQKREQLLSGTRSSHHAQDRPNYLFLNDSICGSITVSGSNSFPCYFYQNTNIKNYDHLIKNDTQVIFENHGYGQLAAGFAAELQQLQQEYLELSKFGTLYLIGVPKETVHLNVVTARTGGYIQPLKVDGQETTDMKKIAAALLSDNYVEPSDQKEYVGIMTHDEHGWLNPASGLKVFPMIIATSKEKRVEFERKWKNFETRLRARIAESKNWSSY